MSYDQRCSVCALTTPDTSFEEDLELISRAGATGIALAEEKFREGEEEQQLRAFRASGLKATICLPTNIAILPVSPALIYGGPQDPEQRVALMCDSIRRMAPYEPDCIVVGTGAEEGYGMDAARKIAVEGLREAADCAASMGLRLSVEPPRRDLGFVGSIVQGLPATLDLLDEIDRPNVGVCYDVYHHWDEPDAIARAEEGAERIYGVQVNDWREPPRCLADRLLPGDGSIDLVGTFSALERGGFRGWYDFELFSDDGRWGTDLPDSLWKLPAAELIERGLAGMKSALEQAGA